MKRRSYLTKYIFTATALLLATAGGLRAKGSASALPSIPGYAAVPVRYNSDNKMLIELAVNGHRARFFVDTGASCSVLDARRARALGVSPVGADSLYGQFINLNGEQYRVGYINSLRASSMDFGSGPMALFSAASVNAQVRSHLSDEGVDGILGADILTRYKAVINCFTKTIFFKTGSSSHLQIARFATSQHFVRVPLHEEVSRGFTVPASINGHPCRLLVDTGAFITTLDLERSKEFGLSFAGTRLGGSFTDGVVRQVGLGEVKNMLIGNYHVPPQKLAAAALPDFAVEQGHVQIAGILGMELLAFSRGIIDLDSMSLFLK